jgi:lipoate-protein ligase A
VRSSLRCAPVPGGTSEWRLIDSGPGSGARNLALDDAIFQSVREGQSPPTLRFYSWLSPTLSLGYAQDRERVVDLEACRKFGIAVLRRVTGGRAVLHDRELTYSVAVPAGTTLFGSGLDTAYRAVAAGLLAGLRLLGVEASAVQRDRIGGSRHHHGCFAAPSRHEIVAGGRKLVGSAQRRAEGAFLQHGSILLRDHGALLGRVLRSEAVPDASEGMIGLADLLQPSPSEGELRAALAAGCAAAWGTRFRRGVPGVEEMRLARELEVARYCSESWNAGRDVPSGRLNLQPEGPRSAPA